MSVYEPVWTPAVTTADTLAFTPFGTIEATNVQDALEEMIGEQNSIVYIARFLVANQLGAI